MGLTLSTYFLLAVLGALIRYRRLSHRPGGWLRSLHVTAGAILVLLVLLLLGIGIVGTLGEYGRLGHSIHLLAGLVVVGLVLVSAWSASRIDVTRPWARALHLVVNGGLFLALAAVSWSGWQVVQKYLP